MFDHCQTFKELNDAYEQACEAVKSTIDFGLVIAAMAAGEEPPSDGRFEQFDAITAAMHARWSELKGEPWPYMD